MKRHLVLNLFLFAFLTGLIVVSVPGRSAAQEVIKLNYANFFPAPEPHSGNIEAWGKEIEQKTNGKVKFTFFHAGTLAPADQIYDSVVKGISDIGLSCFTYTRGKFPLTSVIDLHWVSRMASRQRGWLMHISRSLCRRNVTKSKCSMCMPMVPG